MSFNITDPVFHDETKAREFLEAQRWPDGPVCPFCGSLSDVKRLGGAAAEKGLCHCAACRKKFSVTVGTVMERSHIPLTKWLMTFRLMASSKKGVSAHQVHRMLGITYKSAWFLCHRVREAMGLSPEAPGSGPIGGEGKTSAKKNAMPRQRHRVHCVTATLGSARDNFALLSCCVRFDCQAPGSISSGASHGRLHL